MPRTPDFGGPSSAARRWLRTALSEQLLYKAAAIFLSLVLWMVVSYEQPDEDVVPVDLVLRKDSALALIGSEPVFAAFVAGPRSELLKLRVTPPTLQRTIPGDSIDSLTFEFGPSDLQLPIGVDNVQVRSIDPTEVTLRFTSRVRRRVPVRSRVRVTVDSALRTIGSARIEPDSVTVIGTRQRVSAVEEILTQAANVRIADTTGVLVALDTAGLGVQVVPSQVRLRVPVVRDTLFPLPFLLPWGRRTPGGS